MPYVVLNKYISTTDPLRKILNANYNLKAKIRYKTNYIGKEYYQILTKKLEGYDY